MRRAWCNSAWARAGAWVARIRMPSSALTAPQQFDPVTIVTAGYFLGVAMAKKRGGRSRPRFPSGTIPSCSTDAFPPFDPCARTAAHGAGARTTRMWPRATVIASNSWAEAMSQAPCRLLTAVLFGNPAVFPLRGDPWLCDPASQRVCRFERRCLYGRYPSIASPTSDNGPHNNSGQQHPRSLNPRNIRCISPGVMRFSVCRSSRY